MEVESPNAEPPKRKRRWFQFSLRTLIIVVTLLSILSGYFCRQAQIVRERRAFLDSAGQWTQLEVWNADALGVPALPWIRRTLGDESVCKIILPLATDITERQRIATLFPEAEILALPLQNQRRSSIWMPSRTVQFARVPQ
jgi:hypothetical protein